MTEWWTYSLSDLLMFSARTYYRLMELYNAAIWPGQLIAVAAGLMLLACAWQGGVRRTRIVAVILAACWLWVASAFHGARYASINSAADYFAIGFVIQSVLLLWQGWTQGRLSLQPPRTLIDWIGPGLCGFAVLLYPLIALASGRPWQQMEWFGVMPDPTALATLGILLWSSRVCWLLLPLPLLWCAISGATLATMHAPDFWLAPAAGLLTLLLSAWKACATTPPLPADR